MGQSATLCRVNAVVGVFGVVFGRFRCFSWGLVIYRRLFGRCYILPAVVGGGRFVNLCSVRRAVVDPFGCFAWFSTVVGVGRRHRRWLDRAASGLLFGDLCRQTV